MREERIRKIVVGTDFNELATAALQFAGAIATQTGAALVVVYADTFEPPAEFTAAQVHRLAEAIEHSKARTRHELEAYAAKYVPKSVPWKVVVADGHPAAALAAIAEAEGADFIALGTHGRGGLQRLIMGSVAEAVMREARVPILTLRATKPSFAIRRVLYVGGDETAAHAARLAHAIGAELVRLPAKEPVETLEHDLLVVTGDPKTARNARTPVLTITHAMVTAR
jgi:nucleotide-binding universal stress UspA family protein